MNIAELDLLSEKLTTEAKKDEIEKFVSGVFIIMNGDKTLLLKRADDDFMGGLVENPSGGVDDGETIYQAAIRETKEESGITITSIDKYIGYFDYISGSGRKCR